MVHLLIDLCLRVYEPRWPNTTQNNEKQHLIYRNAFYCFIMLHFNLNLRICQFCNPGS